MFSIEERKSLRKEFWITFAERTKQIKNKRGYSRKWMLYKTGIKDVELKFHVDEKYAAVLLEVNRTNQEQRETIFNIISEFKSLIEKTFKNELIWEKEVRITDKKYVSRISFELDEANIYDKNQWNQIIDFLIRNMIRLERAYRENADFIKEKVSSEINNL